MGFTKKAILLSVGLTVFSMLIVLCGVGLSEREVEFFPGNSSDLKWFQSTMPKVPEADSAVIVEDDGQDSSVTRFSFFVSPNQELPYTSYTLYLADPARKADLINLSAYSRISFEVKCEPKNILVFALHSFAEGFTSINKPETYRVSSDFFTCNKKFKEVSFLLRDLDSAIWWIERYGLEYSNLDADLTKVHGIAFSNSLQSPRGKKSDFTIRELKVIEENSAHFYCSIGLVVLVWLAAISVFIRLYAEEAVRVAKSRLNDSRPFVAYQQLSLKQKDESLKTKLLQYVAVEYHDSGINIDGVAEKLGVNRVKINEILKVEFGLTFTTYINKLRLTEAARLLSLQQNLIVKQIALEVGYSNVTYFNTLFKKEYGCTPKAFSNDASTKQT